MYPPVRERKTAQAVISALAESLDLNHAELVRGRGMTDHTLFGLPDDVVDAARAVERLGMKCKITQVSSRWVLIIKNVWTPGDLNHE